MAAFSGRDGGYYLVRPEYCFQDTGGSTPCVSGDPVGYLTDLSGNGRHLIQATSTSRPLLQQDGSGYYYLQMDGIDDCLASSAATLNLVAPSYLSLVFDKDAQDALVFININPTSSNNSRRIGNLATNSRVMSNSRTTASGNQIANSATNAAPVATKTLADSLQAGAVADIATNNGTPATVATALIPDGTVISSVARIAFATTTTGACAPGKYYGALFINDTSAPTRTVIATLLAGQCGLSI